MPNDAVPERDVEQRGFDRAKAEYQTYRFWFRQKYQLPPTDPRYLAATEEEMIADFWAHVMMENSTVANLGLAEVKTMDPGLPRP